MPKQDKPPYFPFYPDDFACDGDVEAMSTEEVGCYILLLCKAWRERVPCSIPDDDEKLARWCRVTPEAWARCKNRVLAPWEKRGDRYHQRRLELELEKFHASQERRRTAGRAGAGVRWQRRGNESSESCDSNAIAQPSESHANSNGKAMAFDAITITDTELLSTSTRGREAEEAGELKGDEPEPGSARSPETVDGVRLGGVRLSDPLPPTPAVSPEARQAARTALTKWSYQARGTAIQDMHDEWRVFAGLLEQLAEQPPIARAGELVPRHLLVPVAVEHCIVEVKPFRSARYAAATIRGLLDDWSRSGVPTSNEAAPRRSAPTSNTPARSSIREEADEFLARRYGNQINSNGGKE